MTPVEIIALVFAVAILLKALMFLLIKGKPYMKLIDKVFEKKALMPVLVLVLLVIVGYYLLLEMSIVQIYAAGLFGILVYGLALVLYPKALTKFMKAVLKNKSKLWLSVVIWVVLAVWVLLKLSGYSCPG
ncbi:hypothetical protein KY345_06080 [Candidatus Woesearchaeota archaeon]|nr:hypothetical protein [Candidatus Woesearchaeota archaeon]